MLKLISTCTVAVLFAASAQSSAQVPVQKDTPQAITQQQFSSLRWLAGKWVGSGVDQGPFFERYSFSDDSTLIVDSFADSTFGPVTESARYELRGGVLANTGVMRWTAVRIAGDSVVFVPLLKARNGFVWRRDDANRWTAVITWTAKDGKAARRVYDMRRAK